MAENARPDPDQLLSNLRAQQAREKQGRLKLFFGASPGVGKTYAMLEEARKRTAEGEDVLVGYAEPHIRPDTEALLLGMEILPYKIVPYKNAQLKELDLDAALARKPTLILVDELAHTNAPGMRHAKRWQDVMELLHAGIDVYTTLNVQHLESVNDIVERVTGVRVRETLPDWVFERADEVQLVDIPPDKLLGRLAEGKVYRAQQANLAARNFFNRGNLVALRELALRRTAERVDAEMDAMPRDDAATSRPGAVSERILVCVGPSPFSVRLVRAARRMATAMKTQWIAAYVETPAASRLSAEAQERISQTLRLAQQLGGQTVTLSGADASEEILAYARQRNVARIIIGKPQHTRWRERFTGSFVDTLIRKSGAIDIYVIRDERIEAAATGGLPARSPQKMSWAGYGWALGATLAATILGVVFYHRLGFSNINVLMLYLLVVLSISWRFGRGPAIVSAVAGVLAFDYTVVPPYYSFSVSDTQYFFTFAVMLVTGLLISALTDNMRRQTELARRRERRTAALFALSRELAVIPEKKRLLETATSQIAEVFASDCWMLLADEGGHLAAAAAAQEATLDEKEMAVADWAFHHNEPAGATTNTLASARGLYVPLRASQGMVGVLGLTPRNSESEQALRDPQRLQLLEAFAGQTALAVERVNLAGEAQRAWERAESEFLRNTLLSTVSHDLRTPLAAITGAATSMLAPGDMLGPQARQEMLATIADESERMERLINNLLDMTRLETGGLRLNREWFPLPELIVSAVQREEKLLKNRPVNVSIQPDFPLLHVDGVLLEQVFINLLDNAVAYTPPDSAIEIAGRVDGALAVMEVSDHGPGLPDDVQRVFEKFYRGPSTENRRGMGLGLAICRGILELHGGKISAQNRPGGGGAVFRLELPVERQPAQAQEAAIAAPAPAPAAAAAGAETAGA